MRRCPLTNNELLPHPKFSHDACVLPVHSAFNMRRGDTLPLTGVRRKFGDLPASSYYCSMIMGAANEWGSEGSEYLDPTPIGSGPLLRYINHSSRNVNAEVILDSSGEKSCRNCRPDFCTS